MKSFLFVLIAVLLSALAAAASSLQTIEGRIIPNQLMNDISLISSNVRILLDGGARIAFIEEDGSFSISVGEGAHLLEVSSKDYIFDKIRITVTGEVVRASIHLDGTNWSNPGPAVSVPLQLEARHKINYFTPREGFNIMSIFANPMMLMMGASVLMFVVMPRMMKNMDPETLKEMQESQKKALKNPPIEMPDISQNLANWLAPNNNKKK